MPSLFWPVLESYQSDSHPNQRPRQVLILQNFNDALTFSNGDGDIQRRNTATEFIYRQEEKKDPEKTQLLILTSDFSGLDFSDALRKTEKGCRYSVAPIATGVRLSGTQKLYIFSCQLWLKFTDRTLKEERRDRLTSGIDAEDLHNNLKIYWLTFKTGETFKMKYSQKLVGGDDYLILETSVPLLALRGQLGGYISACIEMTDGTLYPTRKLDLKSWRLGELEPAAVFLRAQQPFLQNAINPHSKLSFVKAGISSPPLAPTVSGIFHSFNENKSGTTVAGFNQKPTQAKNFLQHEPEEMTIGRQKFIIKETLSNLTSNVSWLETTEKPLSQSSSGHTCHVLSVASDLTERIGEVAMKKANKELETRVEERTTPQLPSDGGNLRKANEQLLVAIAEREWTEKALRTSEAELRGLLAAMTDVILVFDAQGRYLKIAPTNPTLLYKPASELIGGTLHEVFEPSQAEIFVSYIQRALDTQQTIDAEYNLPIRQPGGTQVQAPVRCFAASISPMQAGLVIWVARDITERKTAEEALREERNFVSTVLETAGALVVVLDPQGRIVRFNRCCEQTTEYSAQEVQGRPFWDIFLVSEEIKPVQAIFEELKTGRCSINYENYWIAKSGDRRLVAWCHTPLFDPDGSLKYVIATGVDITERQLAAAALREANEQLELRVEERTAALRESNDQLVVEIVERKRAEKELRQHKEHLQELVKERTAELEKANEKLRQEIIERQSIEQALFQEKELAQITLHSICDAVITTNALSRITSLNPAAQRLTGWSAQEAIGLPVSEVFQVVHEITREPVDNPVEVALRGNRIGEMANPTLLIAKDGTELAIDESVAPIRASAGQIVGAVLVFHDVTEERALARQLSWQASHDALTGLVNRREFEQHLKRALLIAQTQNQQHALCYLDLDRFKIVNDTCGHVAGDELLRQVSTLLQAGVRKTDSLARLGGDEFALLLHQCPLEQARRIANSLRESIQAFRFVWEDKTFSIGASIGLVAINTESRSLTNVLNAADAACYAAKEQGRNRVHVHQADESELAQQHSQLQWVSRIAKGFEDNRFRLYFQPIVPVIQKLSKIEHYEVLLRLEDEEGTLVSPMAFIPAAERYNIMHTIDRWVIRTLFAHLSAFNHKSCAGSTQHLTVERQKILYGINLSGASLNDDQFKDFLHEQFAFHQIEPHLLCFEIPETVALANLTKVAEFIRDFKKLGCYFALDDFGSGTSSFAYLKNLPVDYLKIDGSFVKNVVDNPLDLAMIEAINSIAHVMGLQTIAEFVENDAILIKLQSLGVDYAQGYGIAKPHPSPFQ